MMQEPCQQPSDPEGLGNELEAMTRAARDYLAGVTDVRDPDAAYLAGALEIHRRMRPNFGPANAMLFNARDHVLADLATQLGLDPGQARTAIDALYPDEFTNDFDRLLAVLAELGLKVETSPADRAGLMWTPAPGYALRITDSGVVTDYKPPYAGTVAGPDVPALPMSACVTFFVFPPIPGQASWELMTRQQPGMPAFFTGNLVGFTLQEPQSGDVNPQAVEDRVFPALAAQGLLVHADEETCLAVVKQIAGEGARVDADHGLIGVSMGAPAPERIRLPMLRAIFWRDFGADATLTLLISE